MKKDAIYTIRMNRTVLNALKRAATKERRTVASLLDKIIQDYLEKEGLTLPPDLGGERRKFNRKSVILPATLVLRGDLEEEAFPIVILNISLGSVLVTYPKGSAKMLKSVRELPNFELSFKLPGTDEQLQFHCDARRMNDTSREIQIGAIFSEPNDEDVRKLQNYLM